MGTAEVGDITYRLAGAWRWWPWAIGALRILFVLWVLRLGWELGGAFRWLSVVVAPLGIVHGVRLVLGAPREIVVGDAVVRLRALFRTTTIPWSELEAVESRRGADGPEVVWTRRSRRPIGAIGRWEREDEMVTTVRHRLDAAHPAESET